MELGSKVTALEEEVAVLKGEIKTILQEVRTAVLARENPFVMDAYETLPAAAPVAPAPVPTPEPEPAAEPPTPPKVIRLNALLDSEPEDEAPAPRNITALDRDSRPSPVAMSGGKRRWSVGSLATLMAWTQDVTTRMDANDLDIVLSMARYGGLIEEELEVTLTKLAAPLFVPNAEKRRVGVSDYLLALRELSALIEDAEENRGSFGSLRRAS